MDGMDGLKLLIDDLSIAMDKFGDVTEETSEHLSDFITKGKELETLRQSLSNIKTPTNNQIIPNTITQIKNNIPEQNQNTFIAKANFSEESLVAESKKVNISDQNETIIKTVPETKIAEPSVIPQKQEPIPTNILSAIFSESNTENLKKEKDAIDNLISKGTIFGTTLETLKDKSKEYASRLVNLTDLNTIINFFPQATDIMHKVIGDLKNFGKGEKSALSDIISLISSKTSGAGTNRELGFEYASKMASPSIMSNFNFIESMFGAFGKSVDIFGGAAAEMMAAKGKGNPIFESMPKIFEQEKTNIKESYSDYKKILSDLLPKIKPNMLEQSKTFETTKTEQTIENNKTIQIEKSPPTPSIEPVISMEKIPIHQMQVNNLEKKESYTPLAQTHNTYNNENQKNENNHNNNITVVANIAITDFKDNKDLSKQIGDKICEAMDRVINRNIGMSNQFMSSNTNTRRLS